MAQISNLGEYLKQEFLNGQGVVTQGPGAYPKSVVQKLGGPTMNKGYDIGVSPGTPINTSKLQYRGAVQDNTGYGLRANYYDPRTNQSYFFSHLSKLEPKNGQMMAYTGGIPGIHGRSTGPHLDIDIRQGLADFGSSFMNGLKAISGNMGRAKPAPAFNLNEILQRGQNTAKSQGKKLLAYASNPERLKSLAQKYKGSVIKL